jgi:hypothetical protein
MERDKKSKWAHEGIAGVTTLEKKTGRSISACNASRNRKQNATRIKKKGNGQMIGEKKLKTGKGMVAWRS